MVLKFRLTGSTPLATAKHFCLAMLAAGIGISAVVAIVPELKAPVTAFAAEVENPLLEEPFDLVTTEPSAIGRDYSVYTTTLTESGRAKLLDELNAKREAEEAARKAEEERKRREAEQAELAARLASSTPVRYSGGYPLNTQGIPMSDMQVPDYVTFGADGLPNNYSYYIDGTATAYYVGPLTSTGSYVHQGAVAVNPRNIPYGTEMYIVSLDGNYVYGWCRAEDTGGFIYMSRGPTVDLYMSSYDDCVQWGFRGVRIYFF